MRRERRHMVLVAGPDRQPLGVLTLDDVLTAIMTG